MGRAARLAAAKGGVAIPPAPVEVKPVKSFIVKIAIFITEQEQLPGQPPVQKGADNAEKIGTGATAREAYEDALAKHLPIITGHRLEE